MFGSFFLTKLGIEGLIEKISVVKLLEYRARDSASRELEREAQPNGPRARDQDSIRNFRH